MPAGFLWLYDDIMRSALTVKRYVRKGVPNEHRARIWMVASGAQERLDRSPGYYQSLLEMEHDAKLKETVHTGQLSVQKLSRLTIGTSDHLYCNSTFQCNGFPKSLIHLFDMHKVFYFDSILM